MDGRRMQWIDGRWEYRLMGQMGCVYTYIYRGQDWGRGWVAHEMKINVFVKYFILCIEHYLFLHRFTRIHVLIIDILIVVVFLQAYIYAIIHLRGQIGKETLTIDVYLLKRCKQFYPSKKPKEFSSGL